MGGVSIMPSLHSLPSPNNTSYPVTVANSILDQPGKIKFTPDYEANEPVFWRVFKELANEHNGLVSYDLLQGGLISSGKLDAGGSVLMIDHMEKTGKIEQTQHYHIYRIKMPAATKEEDMR
jgi:translation elongation factor EF-G